MERYSRPKVVGNLPFPALSLLRVLCLIGCSPEPLPEAEIAERTSRLLFEQEVKPGLLTNCAACHAQKMGQLPPFLQQGNEYDSITQYKGGFFLTRPPQLSYLLDRGAHQGPPLDTPLALAVYDWLVLQLRTGELRPLVTPMVPLAPGEFFLSLEPLVHDPQAKVTFTIESLQNTAQAFLLDKLRITAGSLTGIHLRHPRFVLSSPLGVALEKGDSLSSAEQTLAAGETQVLGAGGVILTKVPAQAQLALVFEQIEARNAQPVMKVECKAFATFKQTIVPTLQADCAGSCHGGANSNATNAFNMTAARSSDATELGRFCAQVLSRVDRQMAAQSPLIRQVTPVPAGTANHPFKFPDPAPFSKAVLAWATEEK